MWSKDHIEKIHKSQLYQGFRLEAGSCTIIFIFMKSEDPVLCSSPVWNFDSKYAYSFLSACWRYEIAVTSLKYLHPKKASLRFQLSIDTNYTLYYGFTYIFPIKLYVGSSIFNNDYCYIMYCLFFYNLHFNTKQNCVCEHGASVNSWLMC